jgi:hypothetical protein
MISQRHLQLINPETGYEARISLPGQKCWVENLCVVRDLIVAMELCPSCVQLFAISVTTAALVSLRHAYLLVCCQVL